MFYSEKFRTNPHPSLSACEAYAAFLAGNDVTIHAIRDAGMHGNCSVHYSSPILTGGEIRVGHAYEGYGVNSVSFCSDDKAAA